MEATTVQGPRPGSVRHAVLRPCQFRAPDVGLVRRLHVFEVDEPGTQAWKRRRFKDLGLAPSATLFFVPVNFERQTWVAEIIKAGFERVRPAVVSSLGVTQYLSV